MKNKYDSDAPLGADVPEQISETEEEQEKAYEQEQDALLRTWQKAHVRELRSILLGNLVQYEDGVYGAGNLMSRFGLGDGAPETLMFGITERWMPYGTTLRNHTKAVAHVGKLMQKIGKPLVLQTIPDTAAVYVKSIFFRPVILMFEDKEVAEGQKELILHGYCGRSLLSGLSIRRAVNRLNVLLPKQIYPRQM